MFSYISPVYSAHRVWNDSAKVDHTGCLKMVLCGLSQNFKVFIWSCLKQAEKEEQAIKEVVAAPLKTEGEFTSQPAEVWANEMVSEPVTRTWGEEVPVPAPVVGGTTAQPVTYNSEDWASQVSTSSEGLKNDMFFLCH
jgi:hypothetical protein